MAPETRIVETTIGHPGDGNFFYLKVVVKDSQINSAEFHCHPCRIAETIGRRLVDLITGAQIQAIPETLAVWVREAREWVPSSRLRALGMAFEATMSAVAELAPFAAPHRSQGCGEL